MSDEERKQFRDDLLEPEAEKLEHPPEVEHVHWAQSAEEHYDLVAECMQEDGWPVESGPGGYLRDTQQIPPDSQEDYDARFYYCEYRYFPEPAVFSNWQEDQLRVVYSYWVEYFAPCLEHHGHEVDLTDRPTVEQFIESYPSDLSWWPADSFQALPYEEQQQLANTCPPEPPPSILYGISTDE